MVKRNKINHFFPFRIPAETSRRLHLHSARTHENPPQQNPHRPHQSKTERSPGSQRSRSNLPGRPLRVHHRLVRSPSICDKERPNRSRLPSHRHNQRRLFRLRQKLWTPLGCLQLEPPVPMVHPRRTRTQTEKSRRYATFQYSNYGRRIIRHR